MASTARTKQGQDDAIQLSDKEKAKVANEVDNNTNLLRTCGNNVNLAVITETPSSNPIRSRSPYSRYRAVGQSLAANAKAPRSEQINSALAVAILTPLSTKRKRMNEPSGTWDVNKRYLESKPNQSRDLFDIKVQEGRPVKTPNTMLSSGIHSLENIDNTAVNHPDILPKNVKVLISNDRWQ